jgi:hemerythrin-like metal-binding protein
MSPGQLPGLTPGASAPVWTPKLSVGNAKLDEQHITLLVLGQHVLRRLEMPQFQLDQIHSALEDIIGLCREHDALEERVLEKNGCPTLYEHKLAHAHARTRLVSLLNSALHDSTDMSVLAHEIADWRDCHICRNDLPVKQYMRMQPGDDGDCC